MERTQRDIERETERLGRESASDRMRQIKKERKRETAGMTERERERFISY